METFFEGNWYDFLEGFFLAASVVTVFGLGIANNLEGRERKHDPFDKVDDGPVDPKHPLSMYEFGENGAVRKRKYKSPSSFD